MTGEAESRNGPTGRVAAEDLVAAEAHWRVVECAGDGRSRGRAHGEEARPIVRDALAQWADATGTACGLSIDRYVSEFLDSTDLVASMQRRLPELTAEMEGIAEGAGVRSELVAAYNLMDERWWYDLEAGYGCSVLAVAERPRVLLAQNLDLPVPMAGTQLVLRVSGPDQPEALVLTSAGLIGLTGVNVAGVAVCVNTLLTLRHGRRGLSVAALVRGVLTHESLRAAVAFLRTSPHASGQHYAVASREGIVGLECSAVDVVTGSNGARLVHTNHPLASASIDPAIHSLLERRGSLDSSYERLRFLAAHVGQVHDIEDARRLLGDRTTPICVAPTAGRRMHTFGAVAFGLGDMVHAEFCLGLPDEAPWRAIEWTGAGFEQGESSGVDRL